MCFWRAREILLKYEEKIGRIVLAKRIGSEQANPETLRYIVR